MRSHCPNWIMHSGSNQWYRLLVTQIVTQGTMPRHARCHVIFYIARSAKVSEGRQVKHTKLARYRARDSCEGHGGRRYYSTGAVCSFGFQPVPLQQFHPMHPQLRRQRLPAAVPAWQVHPAKFTRALVSSAESRGATVRIGTVQGLQTARDLDGTMQVTGTANALPVHVCSLASCLALP